MAQLLASDIAGFTVDRANLLCTIAQQHHDLEADMRSGFHQLGTST